VPPGAAQVLDALRLSRATLRKIKQNMWWAFGYNLLGLPLAAGALLPITGLALTPSISGEPPRRCTL
jgi:Cu+-exporting ATPase